MAGHRRERQIQRWREALDRGADGGGPEGDLTPAQVEDLFFHDHEDLVRGLEEALARAGAQEALLALARHLEEDRDHWLLRLECIQARPALRGRGEALEADYREVFAAHFRRLGAAGAQGERIARLEADLLLAALRGAQRLWVQGRGRPVLPVLVQEALAVVWPALYGHARRHASR